MSERLTNILGYATLGAILVAIWILFGEDPTREQGARGEATFGGLTERINEAYSLSLQGADGAVTITREGENWFVVERSGFPANTRKVREFLRGVALSKRRDPKTDNFDRMQRIGLGSAATKVEIRDETNGLLAAFDMGKRTENAAGDSLTYVFQESDTRSWLVTGLAAAPLNAEAWLEGAKFDINASRIAAVTMGDVTLRRALSEADFSIATVPTGQQAASNFALNEPSDVLSRLTFTDVKKTNNPLQDSLQTIKLNTYDGLVLTLELFELEGSTWAKLVAEYDPAFADSGVAGALPDAPADVEAEANTLNTQYHGWLFQLPEREAALLRQKKADFLLPIAQ